MSTSRHEYRARMCLSVPWRGYYTPNFKISMLCLKQIVQRIQNGIGILVDQVIFKLRIKTVKNTVLIN